MKGNVTLVIDDDGDAPRSFNSSLSGRPAGSSGRL
jgi:hypothetical protein